MKLSDKSDKKECSKEKIEGIHSAEFYGFDQLEREHRVDYPFHGKLSKYLTCRRELIRDRPFKICQNPIADCTIAGPTRLIGTLKDVATIIHGPVGCAHYQHEWNSFLNRSWVVSTQMDENDTIMGNDQKLKEAIEETIKRYHPGAIVVVGTCTSSIIGSDISGISEQMEEETGIPILAFDQPGFKSRSWNTSMEEAMNVLIDRMEKSRDKNKGSINMLNCTIAPFHWKEFLELLPHLQEIGIKINTQIVCPALTYREIIEKFPRAELNVVRCPSTGYQAAEYAEKKLGIPYVRVPKPLSFKYTDEFLYAIADFFGLGDKAEAIIKRERERTKGRLEKVRARLQGKRVGIVCGSGKNPALAQAATEMGMEVVYLAVYQIDPLYHETLDEWREEWGQDPEILAEPTIYEQEAIISRLRPDLFIATPEEMAPLDRVGIPTMCLIGPVFPAGYGYEGTLSFGELVAAVLENKFVKKWNHYVWKGFPPYSSEEYLAHSAI